MKYIIEIQKGVWIAKHEEGDPPRTLVKENARIFKNREAAEDFMTGVEYIFKRGFNYTIVEL